jgi:hypothetical protein
MPDPKPGKFRWNEKWLRRYRGPNQANYEVIQAELLARHAQRLQQRKQARQEEPIQHPLTLEPGLDPNTPLELKWPFRPTRPSQIPRLRLLRRPLLLPPSDDSGSLPAPLRLPLLHALLSFIFLSLLPQHPLSIPTALGLAFACIFYIQFLAFTMLRFKGLKVQRYEGIHL